MDHRPLFSTSFNIVGEEAERLSCAADQIVDSLWLYDRLFLHDLEEHNISQATSFG